MPKETKPVAAAAVTPSRYRSRIVGYGEEAPDQLLANPKNWRIHPQHQQDALSGVLEQVGWVQSVVVNKRTGFVVDGHLRVSLALRAEEAAIPVVYVDLSEAEESLVLATIDPISALAGTDTNLLRDLISTVGADNERVTALLDGIALRSGLTGLTFAPLAPIEGEQGMVLSYTVRIKAKGTDTKPALMAAVKELLEANPDWNAQLDTEA